MSKSETPWKDRKTIFDIMNIDSDGNAYAAPLICCIAAERPIQDHEEAINCTEGITQLSGFIAKVMFAAEHKDIELSEGDFIAISEIQEIIRVLSLRLEQWAHIQPSSSCATVE